MSSALLFAAIVAIWIGVLVPRWLRHEHARDGQLRLRRFSRRREGDRQDGDTNARAGVSQGGQPRNARFADHGEPREDHANAGEAGRYRDAGAAEYDLAPRTYDVAYASVARNGNTGDTAQLYETDEAPAPVRSYGWSADEYFRHERASQRAPHRDRRPVERREQNGRERREPPQHDERRQHGSRSDGARYGSRRNDSRRNDSARSDSRRNDSARDHQEQRPGNRGRRPARYRATAESQRRAGLARARRRLLGTLITLTAAATGLAYLRLAAWWTVIVPVVLLGGYLALLRETAHADAEARERSAVQAGRARDAEARRKAEAEAAAGRTTGTDVPTELSWDSAETHPSAEIIDISGRVADELYDQYADAKLRAVGD